MPTTSPPTANGWLTLNQAAVYLSMSRRTLERAVKARAIPHARDPITGRVRFNRDELDRWMSDGGRRAR